MEEMVRNGVSEDSEEFQRVKAQWAYACELRDYYESTPPAPAATPRPPDDRLPVRRGHKENS
jgi:hypothetical protein